MSIRKNSYVILESVEELRSNLSLMKTDFYYMKSCIENENRKYYEKKQLPPIPNPKHINGQIESEIEKISNNMKDLESQYSTNNTSETLRLLLQVNMLLNELNSNLSFLQSLVNQRFVSSSTPIEFIHYFHSDTMSMATIRDVQIAADCVLGDFVKKIMGHDWMTLNKYTPLTFFAEDYQIGNLNYIAQIPLSDRYRCRFWAILCHEVAHIKISELLKNRDPLFITLFTDIQNELLKWPLNFQKSSAQKQIIELFCDLIAAYVCGPAFLNASAERLRPDIPLRINAQNNLIFGSEGELIESIRTCFSHPPNDVRIYTMLKLIVDVLGLNDGWICTLDDFVNFKNDELLGKGRLFIFLDTYKKVIDLFFDEISSFMNTAFESNSYSRTKWDAAKLRYEKNEFRGNEPIDLLNLVWFDRNLSFQKGTFVELDDFFKSRENETKLFPIVVNYLCEYNSNHLMQKREF